MNIPAAAPTMSSKPATKVSTGGNIREYGLMIALVVIMVFFQFTTHGDLFKPVNLTNIILQNSYVIIMALGMLLVIVAGFIDLSVGSVAGFIGAASVAGLGCRTQRAFRFVVRAGHGLTDTVRLDRRLGRYESEQLLVHHEPHQFVDQ